MICARSLQQWYGVIKMIIIIIIIILDRIPLSPNIGFADESMSPLYLCVLSGATPCLSDSTSGLIENLFQNDDFGLALNELLI